MSILEEICLLSSEQWVDSFPEEIPKHEFSKKHNEKMKELFKEESKINTYRLSKNTIRFLLIAAILLSITITAFAFPQSREFIISRFSNHSEYNITEGGEVKKVKSLEVNYIPEGFEKTEEYKSKYSYYYNYENSEMNFSVDKSVISGTISYDTEKYEDKIIEINGVEAIYFKPDDDLGGIIFNNGDYIFIISGNIGEKELVKIAQNVE